MKKISITFKYEEYTNDIEKIDKEPKEIKVKDKIILMKLRNKEN